MQKWGLHKKHLLLFKGWYLIKGTFKLTNKLYWNHIVMVRDALVLAETLDSKGRHKSQ